LTSSGPCCSFDGCKTCADWCTQQGKDVCLARQGAPGGGCDNSHNDPRAHPPQWCEAGAGELSANDAPVSEDGETAALLQHAGTRAQEHMPNCFRPECVENGCDPITPPECNGNHGYGTGSNCDQTEDQCHNCLSGGLPGVWCGGR
jgi:hypothetical protein